MTGWDTPLNYAAIGAATVYALSVLGLARMGRPRLAVAIPPAIGWIVAGSLVGWHSQALIGGPWFLPAAALGWMACFWFGSAGVGSLVAAAVHRPTRAMFAGLTCGAGFGALFAAACAVSLEASAVAYGGWGSWPIARGWAWTAHGAAAASALGVLGAGVAAVRVPAEQRGVVASLGVALIVTSLTAGYAAWVVWVLRKIPSDWALYGIPSWVVTPGY
ncbi:MAG: hypothetical protein ACI8PZ_005759 [Myxococcota bacterium]|jgi:hypothetical protein